MMTILRTQMKTIMMILVVAFLATIVFSWGMGGFKDDRGNAGILGKVDNFEISVEAFESVINRQIQASQSQADGGLDADAVKKMREDGWRDQVEAILKGFEAQKLKLSVSDREIAYVVENNPPAEIQQAEMFLTEGQFDISKYRDFLLNPEAAQYLIGMEESVRNYLIESNLLFNVQQAASVTEEEVRDEYLKTTGIAKFQFLSIIFNDVDADSAAVTDEMMHRYYRIFQERYKTHAKRQFAYVKFSLEATDLDEQDVRDEAAEIITELKIGGDFAELAGHYSQDEGSAAVGGDLGWFGKGVMAAEFEEAAFAAEIGELVGPIESKFGYHIIRVDDKRREDGEDQISARHILLKIEPSSDTRDQVYNDAYGFAEDALTRGFEAVAEEFDYFIDTTTMFSKSGYIARLGRMRMAALFCFNNPIGTISSVYPIPEGYVVFKVSGATEDGFKPFEDVESSIRKSLLKITRKNHAIDQASEIRGKTETFDDIAGMAVEYGLDIHVTDDSLKVSGKLPDGLKRDPKFMTEAFRLEEGEFSDVIVGKNAAYIVYAESKSRFNKNDFKTSHFAIYQSLMNRKRDAVAKNWIRELRIAADIKDFRYDYYRDF